MLDTKDTTLYLLRLLLLDDDWCGCDEGIGKVDALHADITPLLPLLVMAAVVVVVALAITELLQQTAVGGKAPLA